MILIFSFFICIINEYHLQVTRFTTQLSSVSPVNQPDILPGLDQPTNPEAFLSENIPLTEALSPSSVLTSTSTATESGFHSSPNSTEASEKIYKDEEPILHKPTPIKVPNLPGISHPIDKVLVQQQLNQSAMSAQLALNSPNAVYNMMQVKFCLFEKFA